MKVNSTYINAVEHFQKVEAYSDFIYTTLFEKSKNTSENEKEKNFNKRIKDIKILSNLAEPFINNKDNKNINGKKQNIDEENKYTSKNNNNYMGNRKGFKVMYSDFLAELKNLNCDEVNEQIGKEKPNIIKSYVAHIFNFEKDKEYFLILDKLQIQYLLTFLILGVTDRV